MPADAAFDGSTTLRFLMPRDFGLFPAEGIAEAVVQASKRN